jgi:hypothetical protein
VASRAGAALRQLGDVRSDAPRLVARQELCCRSSPGLILGIDAGQRRPSTARAAGIHLFLITQRPDKDALPGQVKANMNNKICLRVSSQTNSRIVLDENGAEKLLGNGHFAAKLANERPSNQTSLIFAQVPFLDDDAAFDLAAATVSSWKDR